MHITLDKGVGGLLGRWSECSGTWISSELSCLIKVEPIVTHHRRKRWLFLNKGEQVGKHFFVSMFITLY